MELKPDEFITLVLGVAVCIVVVIISEQWFQRRKIERWTRQHGYRLHEFRGRRPVWHGPRPSRQTKNQKDFYFVVLDKSGRRGVGWFVYTYPWHNLAPRDVDIKWDDPGSVRGPSIHPHRPR